jgi:DNA-binding MarR family transcriptional regulator
MPDGGGGKGKPVRGRAAPASEGGFLLGKASRLSAKRFERLMREAGGAALEAGQGRVVYLLWKEGELAQKELAVLAGLDKSTLALTLDRLEEKGLVLRRQDGGDGRRSLVSASPKAKAAYEAWEGASRDMSELFYRGFDAAERRLFEGFLRRIIANLEEAE